MRTRWHFGVALMISGAIVAGCGGSDGANDDRRAQQPQSTQPEGAQSAAAQATVALTGCVEAAPGTNQYVLRNVQFTSAQGSNPHRSTTTPGGHGITEGSWVRLDAADRDLDQFLGQRVRMTGSIADSGRNTIGTAGSSGNQLPSGDRSQAASAEDHSDKVRAEAGRIARESMANGAAAQVTVSAMEGTGERCQLEARPERR